MIGNRMRRDERGFALIFTLLVTTMVMAAVGTSLVITTPNITASKTSQDISAALLAAESGIQDSVAYLTSVPACRSETRICTQAYKQDSVTLNRPTLGTNQSFHWTTGSGPTADGYVRVTSVGTEAGVSRTLVADLSLDPSILKYGYYSNYESQTPAFFNTYYGPRTIDVTDPTIYGDISSSYRGSTSAPKSITWNGAGVNPPSGYSDAVCAQHWYSEGSNSPGRAATVAAQQVSQNNSKLTQTQWAESGSFNSSTVYHLGSCDLVFTAGMVENGPTYTRDAIDIANGNGSGPVFNQPVSTLWGYAGKNNPAVPSSPWRQSDGTGNDTLSASPNKPQVATQDITLPTTIGTDGIQTNSCVYYGPTRVVLNGDGTATVTSPATTMRPSGADLGCYPSGSLSTGIVGFTYNYSSIGSGTIYVKNMAVPSTGTFPVTNLKSTSTPSASNTVFWIPDTTSTVTADPSSSSAPSSYCASGNTYSSSANATCGWTNLPNGTNATSSQGWTAYGTTTKCNALTSSNANDRELFECEYSHITSASTPTVDQYAALRTILQNKLSSGTCVTGSLSSQQSCIVGAMNNALATANTSQHAYNYSSPANGDHQYYAKALATGTATSSTSSLSPTPGDAMFTFSGTPGQEKSTNTPLNFTVYRQTYNSSNKTWGSNVAQFTFTAVHTDWTVTSQPNGNDFFPSTKDVTPYAAGSTADGTAAGTSGADQPGDLYVEGVNQGTLSLVAQNNVEITGSITKGAGKDSSAANPVSITAGNDIRNYHPVSCTDQTPADINATSAGTCPNDITGLYTSSTLINSDGSFTAQHPAAQYTDMSTSNSSTGIADRTIDAALFTLNGSLRTDNYDRGTFVGNLNIYGGIYQNCRGANGVNYGNGSNTPGHTGTSLNYNYVDLQRANLQYVPSASYSSNPRVWNVVSVSDG